MSKALYRKYRSKTLDEVIGQKHITDIMSRSITSGKISHAYLLTGPRGVGKTSVARILAYEINGIPYDEDGYNLDIIEIDAASNNGVEDVRDLREKVQIAPVSAKKKIYIIDEVHMLTKAAFNALLKTLEEPPEHVVFILATTNAEKLPATIISRTQRFTFRPIKIDDISKHLAYIAEQEKIKIEKDALDLIANRGDGSFRDSISLLDQLSSIVDTNDTITAELIENTLGLASHKLINQLIESVEGHDLKKVVELLNDTFNHGTNCAVLVDQLTNSISQQIALKPQLLPLLDDLIEVTKSSNPQLKLLSVLGKASAPKTVIKSAALLAPTLEVSATIAELEERATADITKSRSDDASLNNAPTNDTTSSSDVAFLNDPLEPKSNKAPRPSLDLERSRVEKISASEPKKSSKIDISAFEWPNLLEHTRQNYIALHSVLIKCTHQVDGTDLLIYTNSNFWKKKLDDTKYAPLLSKCLQDIGVFGLDIHTIPTAVPPSDEQAAAVAAIMGGGEEVSLEPA